MKTPSILLAALAILATSASVATASPPCNNHARVQIPDHAIRGQLIARERSRTAALMSLTMEDTANTEDKVPSLGKVPYIKRLFKNKGADNKANTIIMVTPRIVETSELED